MAPRIRIFISYSRKNRDIADAMPLYIPGFPVTTEDIFERSGLYEHTL